MNPTIDAFARQQIKDGLAKLPEKNHMIFKRMYSPKNLELDINTVVDKMDSSKLDWALTQVQRTKVPE